MGGVVVVVVRERGGERGWCGEGRWGEKRSAEEMGGSGDKGQGGMKGVGVKGSWIIRE